jgi:hypothetical protein
MFGEFIKTILIRLMQHADSLPLTFAGSNANEPRMHSRPTETGFDKLI